MGFCLFEHAYTRNSFFAVNGAHVNAVTAVDAVRGLPACRFEFDFKPGGFDPVGLGTAEEITHQLREAAKIALMKAEIEILTGTQMWHPRPLLLNDPGRVALVRELEGAEFLDYCDENFVTASALFMADGALRHIVERPGAFALRANVGGAVPILRVKKTVQALP